MLPIEDYNLKKKAGRSARNGFAIDSTKKQDKKTLLGRVTTRKFMESWFHNV